MIQTDDKRKEVLEQELAAMDQKFMALVATMTPAQKRKLLDLWEEQVKQCKPNVD